jgi:hypothetical protein
MLRFEQERIDSSTTSCSTTKAQKDADAEGEWGERRSLYIPCIRPLSEKRKEKKTSSLRNALYSP